MRGRLFHGSHASAARPGLSFLTARGLRLPARPPPMRRKSRPVCQRPVTRGVPSPGAGPYEAWWFRPQGRNERRLCRAMDACMPAMALDLRSCCVTKGPGRNSGSSLLMARSLDRYRCQFHNPRTTAGRPASSASLVPTPRLLLPIAAASSICIPACCC